MTIMEFNLFIVPITVIAVQVLKRYIPTKHVPLLAIAIGGIAGLAFGLYYGGDNFEQVFNGIVYGASASGLYDAVASQVKGS